MTQRQDLQTKMAKEKGAWSPLPTVFHSLGMISLGQSHTCISPPRRKMKEPVCRLQQHIPTLHRKPTQSVWNIDMQVTPRLCVSFLLKAISNYQRLFSEQNSGRQTLTVHHYHNKRTKAFILQRKRNFKNSNLQAHSLPRSMIYFF